MGQELTPGRSAPVTPQLLTSLVSAAASSIAGAAAVTVTRLSAQRTERIRIRLAADLDRERIQLAASACNRQIDSGQAVVISAAANSMTVIPQPGQRGSPRNLDSDVRLAASDGEEGRGRPRPPRCTSC
jgi:hypothetical protein